MAGLVPAIHVFVLADASRRGCPGQARAWRSPRLGRYPLRRGAHGRAALQI